MRVVKISSQSDVIKIMERLGVDPAGTKIMEKKCEIMLFLIKDLPVGAANILKQDALSIGADAALPSGAVTCSFKKCDLLLMGTKKHIEILSKKEKAQPYGLKDLARELSLHIDQRASDVKIMGVINVNSDSFYPMSRFDPKAALSAIERMIEEGADMIDIGAVSSRPGSDEVPLSEEIKRVSPVLELLKDSEITSKALFSIDTYRPEVAKMALEAGFKIVNDITGLRDSKMCEVVSFYEASVVIMHMQNEPKNMQADPRYEDVVSEVSRFFEERIEKARRFSIPEEKIILDPGIGFGKRLEHNAALLNGLSHFKRFGREILVGASRKSMIDHIYPSKVEERLPGTIVLHLKALREGAQIIRCHDVKEHKQAFAVERYLNGSVEALI